MRLGYCLFILALSLVGCAPSEEPPTVTGAWVRAAPPSAGMTAGYLTLTNPGDRPLTLTTVRSPAFDSIELHTTIMEDGVAKMREEKDVQVPPKGSVAFEPGGRHLMMFGARRPLTVGETVTLVLEIDAGRDAAMLTIEVEAAIRRGGGRDHH